MNFQIINDGAAAGLTFDLNSGTAMAQMPLRPDVVKTITIENPYGDLITATTPKAITHPYNELNTQKFEKTVATNPWRSNIEK